MGIEKFKLTLPDPIAFLRYFDSLSKRTRISIGVRAGMNKEDQKIIQAKEFKAEILKIKENLCIPKLTKSKDQESFEYIDDEGVAHIAIDSRYLWGMEQSSIDKWNQEVQRLLDKYKFPEYFREIIEPYILYEDIQELKNTFYLPTVFDVVGGRTHFYTTEEKKQAKLLFRSINLLPLKGKIPKDYLPAYNELIKNLNQKKNKRRGKQIPISRNIEIRERINLGGKYKDIADELIDSEEGGTPAQRKIVKQKAKALKQQNYRFKKRIS